ncbi:MAG TPA: hypothetical protein VF438_01145 [Candidatus Paceibacterota bacterium]
MKSKAELIEYLSRPANAGISAATILGGQIVDGATFTDVQITNIWSAIGKLITRKEGSTLDELDLVPISTLANQFAIWNKIAILG